jgi:hypothetical protein
MTGLTFGSTCARLLTRTALITVLAAVATPAHAQLNGENLLGDFGVSSGTQAPPGVYISNIYYRYFTDTIKGPDGTTLALDPTGSGKQTINAATPMVIYVSTKRIFGATFGMMAVMPIANGALEAPGIGVSEEASTGLSDAYVMPLQLGWRTSHADFIAGAAFFAPTGRYTAGASDNIGKGMWSYELSAGTTIHLDRERTWSLATTAFWETHSKKSGDLHVENVTLTDVKVGDLLTLEGGLGKTFKGGALTVGAAYYAQWKITDDQFGTASTPEMAGLPTHHRVFGIGPEVTVPIATKTKVITLVNVRYLWETGAEAKTQGQSLLVTTTVPIGGIKIPGR